MLITFQNKDIFCYKHTKINLERKLSKIIYLYFHKPKDYILCKVTEKVLGFAG